MVDAAAVGGMALNDDGKEHGLERRQTHPGTDVGRLFGESLQMSRIDVNVTGGIGTLGIDDVEDVVEGIG